MTLEVLKALAVILEFCMNQDSCKNCPMAQFCYRRCHVSGNLIPFGKMPRLPSGVEFSHRLGHQK